jgi:hypothetical protein
MTPPRLAEATATNLGCSVIWGEPLFVQASLNDIEGATVMSWEYTLATPALLEGLESRQALQDWLDLLLAHHPVKRCAWRLCAVPCCLMPCRARVALCGWGAECRSRRGLEAALMPGSAPCRDLAARPQLPGAQLASMSSPSPACHCWRLGGPA